MIKIASKIYGWLLKINGYTGSRIVPSGYKIDVITKDLKHITVERVGNRGGYWIDKATGMPVVPV